MCRILVIYLFFFTLRCCYFYIISQNITVTDLNMLYLLQVSILNCSANLHGMKYVSIHKTGVKLDKKISLKGVGSLKNKLSVREQTQC